MTAITGTLAPAGAQRISMTRLVRIEWLKLTSVRLSYGLLATSAGLTALWTILMASRAGQSSGGPALDTFAGQQSIITGGAWGLILAAVLGVIVASGEFRHHTATLTYLAAPARGRVLAAKAVAGAAGGAVFGLVGFAITLTVGLSFTAAHGDRLVVGAGTLTDWGLGHLVGAALLAAIGVAVGSLVRSQLATVIGIFAWSILIESLIGGLFPAARPYLPYNAASTLAGTPLGTASFGAGRSADGILPLPFAAVTALLAAIAVAAALVAARTTVRRDVT